MHCKKVLKIRILLKIYIIKYIKHFYSIPHMKLHIPNVKWNMTYFLHHLTRLKSFDVKYVTFQNPCFYIADIFLRRKKSNSLFLWKMKYKLTKTYCHNYLWCEIKKINEVKVIPDYIKLIFNPSLYLRLKLDIIYEGPAASIILEDLLYINRIILLIM